MGVKNKKSLSEFCDSSVGGNTLLMRDQGLILLSAARKASVTKMHSLPHRTLNLKAPLMFTPVGQEQESEAAMGTDSPKPELSNQHTC